MTELSDEQLRALEYLYPNYNAGPGAVGAEVYNGGRKPQAYARPGANLLRGLEKLRMVEAHRTGRFSLTKLGRNTLMEHGDYEA